MVNNWTRGIWIESYESVSGDIWILINKDIRQKKSKL